jgi:hypothetical protein
MGLAAVVGIVIAREFGRGADTDGFFAAYGLFVVLVLAASAFRLVVLPGLARAAAAGRLAGEVVAYALTLGVLALPAVLVALLAPGWLAGLLTGSLPDAAQDTAADALVWMVPAAVAQLYAGLGASALAALDDYAVAAAGFAAGSAAGLVLILVRVDADGIDAISWGIALNGAVALAVPAVALLVRAGRARSPVAIRELRVAGRLGEFARGVALPLVLQALYVVCIRFAGGEGVGSVTSFSYAYLAAAALVAVTASSLALVASVPLTRLGLEGGRTAEHVVAVSWLSLALVAGAAGIFALAGEQLLSAALGPAFEGEVGSDLGRLVVYLSPWMVASVGLSVTFPLLFVAGRDRALPLLAGGALAAHVPLAWAGGELAGLPGIAGALALTTAVALAALVAMLSPAALARVAGGLGSAAVVTGGLAVVSFVVLAVLLEPVAAAGVGLGVYALLLGLLRPPGLRRAWAYVHALS